MAYADIYARWQADPEGFWLDAAGAIDWTVKPQTALKADRAPLYEWFPDAMGNTCWNAVDRHVLAGRGAQAAIIHDSPVTRTKHTITYAELQDRVARLAGALKAKGITKGDRVIIYMPMVPEALEAMLACARLGAIHSVVFGGFAAHELAVRIDDAKPGARRVAAIRAAAQDAACALADSEVGGPAPLRAALGEGIRIEVADPMGAEQTPGPDHYAATMRALAAALRRCLDS